MPPTPPQEVQIIRGLEGVLTGSGMNHTIEFLGTKQVTYQIENQTTAMINWGVATVGFPIASVRRRMMQCNKVVFEEEHSHIENRNGKRQGSVVQGNVYRLRPKTSNGMDEFEMRTREDRAEERLGPSTNESSTEPVNIQQKLTHAETRGPRVSVGPDPENPSEAERDDHNATSPVSELV